MSLPKTLVTRYFQLINNRQFTEAQRELQRIKEKITRTEWNRGYYRALLGMLLAQKHNGNQYTFLANLNSADRQTLKQHRNELQAKTESRFAEDYDRGYFTAWTDYLKLLLRTADEAKPQPPLQPQPQNPEAQTSLTQYEESMEPE
jgi:hypothetical protein